MRLFFIIVFFAVMGCAKSQRLPREIITEKEVQYPSKDTVDIQDFHYCIFPDEPIVDFGIWKKYLSDNLILDDASLDTIPAGRYTVIVQFEVGKNGQLDNISILKEPGYGLGERVKKAISNCQGIWKPVIDEKGQVTRNYRRQPITFIVEEACEELPAELKL